MKQTNKGWKVSDAGFESKRDKDHISWARRTASVVHSVVNFLDAYNKSDKTALEGLATEKFYRECFEGCRFQGCFPAGLGRTGGQGHGGRSTKGASTDCSKGGKR